MAVALLAMATAAGFVFAVRSSAPTGPGAGGPLGEPRATPAVPATLTTPAGRPIACPGDGVAVRPGDNLQRLVDANPAGTTFCLGPGTYRMVQVKPKDRQRFIGAGRRTVLSGARILEAADAIRDGDRWYWTGQTQSSAPYGELLGVEHGDSNPGDAYNEELFSTPSSVEVGDIPVRLRRVTSAGELGPGRWFLDDANDRIYVADDPARLGLVETSVAPLAITAFLPDKVEGVTIENLVVEKYASKAQQAAVGGTGATDWDIRYVTVRDCHGTGVDMGPGTLVEHSEIRRMGQQGLTGGGEATDRPTLLRATEVADNGRLSFDPEWEKGGAKFSRTFDRGMIVENSWFHGNAGNGLWFDIDNFNVVIRSNLLEDNDRSGIFYEVSRDAKIYWNEVRGSTPGPENFSFSGAGIVVSNSSGVEIFGNHVYGNRQGIFIRQDPDATRWAQDTYREGLPQVEDVHVRGNDVQMPGGLTGLFVETDTSDSYRESLGVVFSDNTYRIDSVQQLFMGSRNDVVTYDDWQKMGNDRGSRVLPSSSTGSLPGDAVPFQRMDHYGATG